MPQINKDILPWARENAFLSVEEAANRLQLKDSAKSTAAEKLLTYEQGVRAPSRSMLDKMAQLYRKPLVAFYMDRPPRRGDRGEDFRTLPEGQAPAENNLVDVMLRDVKARQNVLRETLIEEDDAVPLAFIGQFNMDNSVGEIASSITQTLGFELERFRGQRSVEDAFKYLRSLTESVGVYVLLAGNLGSHHTNMSPAIFRGFVLADAVAPFIVVSDQDSKAAWSFTLLHEVAHLWLGRSGVSGGYSERKIEKLCNDVASAILLPAAELKEFQLGEEDFEDLAKQVSAFAWERRVSSKLVSYRLFRQGLISKKDWGELDEFFFAQWSEAQAREKGRNKQRDGAPSYYVVRRHRLGGALLDFAQRMTSSGALSMTKAGLILGVRPINVQKLLQTGAIE